MEIDERKLPSIFIATFIIIILLIAFYYNFIPSTVIIRDEEKSVDRVTNLYYEEDNIQSENLLLSPCKFLQSENKYDINNIDIVYIYGNVEISNNFNNGVLFQLKDDSIYTVTIPSVKEKDLFLNIWNNTNTIKNIKFSNSIMIDNNKKYKLITLKKQEVIKIKSNNTSWKLVSFFNVENSKF